MQPDAGAPLQIVHVTTVDMSLALLVFPQLLAVRDLGGTAVGMSAPGPFLERLEGAGIAFVPLERSTRGVHLGADLRTARDFWRYVRRNRPDVVHTHTPKPGIYGRILARLAGVPIVVNTVHGLYATEDDPIGKRLAVYLAEAIASRFSDAELVQSAEDLRLLHRLRIAPRSHLRFLGNGVDLSRFDRSRLDDAERSALRAELGAADGAIVVGTVGRLVAEKGYVELLEAARMIGDDRFLFVWIGPEEPDKADALSSHQLAEAEALGVRLLGMRSDVDRWYGAMDLFVLPSHREGFPRGAMEAAASGLPVIASDIRGCREVVAHGVTGLLVPVRDPGALAAAITGLGRDEARRTAMARAAREKAEADFDEDRVVATVIGSYREVARAKGMVDVLDRLGSDGQEQIRPAGVADASFLAALHARAIATGFLPRLGRRFLRVLYRAMIQWPESSVLVADVGGQPVGYVAGVADTGRFYRHFLKRHALRAALAALPRVLDPRIAGRAVETLRYSGTTVEARAELLAMAVTARARGRGLGTELGRRFLAELAQWDAGPVRVVVAADNEAAIGAYRKMGFVDAAELEVHRGERSVMLVFTPASN